MKTKTKHFVPAPIDPTKHVCQPEHAEKFKRWLRENGGIAFWRSANLSNPSQTWSAPAFDAKGRPHNKPTWQAEDQPTKIITNIDDVVVVIDKEVKRIKISIRQAFLSLKLTDASSKRLRKELAKYEGSTYAFEDNYAVILAPEKVIPLKDYQPEEKDQEGV